MKEDLKQVRTFGKRKNATAFAIVKAGHGVIRVNGKPLHLIEPESIRTMVFEPILIVGGLHFKDLKIRVRVKGGPSAGSTSPQC